METKSPAIKSLIAQKAEIVNGVLANILQNQDLQSRMKEAISYSLLSDGKRLRGVLVLLCCELTSGRINTNAEFAAAAVEMVHTYSLIHDDLPAMDDDDLRRGKPSSHKAFDEATAILAGDALLTMAVEMLSKSITPAETAIAMIAELTSAAGPAGMIAGQMADITAENSDPDLETLEYIHINKTAKMFRAATVLGALAGGADDNAVDALAEFGMKLGLGFQIADDILDVNATTESLGKTAGKDAEQGKMTYPALMGLEKSKQIEKNIAQQAIDKLKLFGDKASDLINLTTALLERNK